MGYCSTINYLEGPLTQAHVEGYMGIEPTPSGWKPEVLPLYEYPKGCEAQPSLAEVYLLEFRLFNL